MLKEINMKKLLPLLACSFLVYAPQFDVVWTIDGTSGPDGNIQGGTIIKKQIFLEPGTQVEWEENDLCFSLTSSRDSDLIIGVACSSAIKKCDIIGLVRNLFMSPFQSETFRCRLTGKGASAEVIDWNSKKAHRLALRIIEK